MTTSTRLPMQTSTQGTDILFSAKSDPKPKRGRRNLQSAALLLGALAGSYYADNAVEAGRNWTEARVQQVEEGNGADSFVGKTLDKAAEVETDIRDVKFVTGAQNVYVTMVELQLLLLALTAFKGVRQKTIDPKDIYKELHDRGVTGKGLKIGVVDSGFKNNRVFNKAKVDFYEPDNFDKTAKYKDKQSHGTAVTELIRKGMPDAEFIAVSYATKEDEKEVSKIMSDLIKQAEQDPTSLKINQVREVYKPLIENLANGIKKCVDEGASVVNVSLSVEQAVKINLMFQVAMQALTVPYHFGKQQISGKKNPKIDAKINLIEQLGRMISSDNVSDKVNDELKLLYQPWIEALDYAHSKNVPVVLASGNSGGHNNKSSDNIGQMNLLALTDHPALIIVGSTNEAGEISKFTSESNDVVLPDIAANGSGELQTDTRISNRSLWKKIVSPFGGIKKHEKYQNPKGTSFAAPDVTLLVGAMQAVRGEQPELSIEELKEVLTEVAESPEFSPRQKKLIEREVRMRLGKSNLTSSIKKPSDDPLKDLKSTWKALLETANVPQEKLDAEVQKEIERRVGSGTIVGKRMEAVERAEQKQKTEEE